MEWVDGDGEGDTGKGTDDQGGDTKESVQRRRKKEENKKEGKLNHENQFDTCCL